MLRKTAPNHTRFRAQAPGRGCRRSAAAKAEGAAGEGTSSENRTAEASPAPETAGAGELPAVPAETGELPKPVRRRRRRRRGPPRDAARSTAASEADSAPEGTLAGEFHQSA